MQCVHILLFFKLLSESEQHLLEMHNAKEKTENEKEDLNQQVNVLTRQGIKFCMYANTYCNFWSIMYVEN